MHAVITKKQTPINILFSGWINLAHSYSLVNCFQLLHLYKNYGPSGKITKNAIQIYVQEAPYYNPDWNSKKKLVYSNEYNEIILGFQVWNGEDVDLIYSITYPYNINVTSENKSIPKCVFYTSEFSRLDHTYFQLEKPTGLDKTQYDDYITLFLKEFNNIYFTAPSEWSTKGITRFLDNNSRNRVITHGVDTTIFKKDVSQRAVIRQMYNIKDTDILMINIGAMTTNKGILLILEAMNILVNQLHQIQFKLLLKGSGELYKCQEFLESYFDQFKQLNIITQEGIDNLLQNHIIFTNKTLSYKRINDLFNASDLYISPYLAEGYNLTPHEAITSGLHVLVPKTGSTKEYIELLYLNGGEDYITFVDSDISSDQNGLCQNEIKVTNLVNSILQNQERFKAKISDEVYHKMQSFIQKELSWDKVSTLLMTYFQDIVNSPLQN